MTICFLTVLQRSSYHVWLSPFRHPILELNGRRLQMTDQVTCTLTRRSQVVHKVWHQSPVSSLVAAFHADGLFFRPAGDLENRAVIREPATLIITNATRSDTAKYRCEVTAIDDQKSFDEIVIDLVVRGTLFYCVIALFSYVCSRPVFRLFKDKAYYYVQKGSAYLVIHTLDGVRWNRVVCRTKPLAYTWGCDQTCPAAKACSGL